LAASKLSEGATGLSLEKSQQAVEESADELRLGPTPVGAKINIPASLAKSPDSPTFVKDALSRRHLTFSLFLI